MSEPEQITVQELLARAERDELLTITDLELLLADQHTPVSKHTVRDWFRCGRFPQRTIPRRDTHGRNTVRVEGHVVIQILRLARRLAA